MLDNGDDHALEKSCARETIKSPGAVDGIFGKSGTSTGTVYTGSLSRRNPKIPEADDQLACRGIERHGRADEAGSVGC